MTASKLFAQADALRLPLADQSVDLVLGSPPYCDARTYDDGTLPAGRSVSLGVSEWVDWMLGVTSEALRVSRGAVVWVAAGVTRDRNYWPACEGLMWEWFKRGGHAYRPVYWHRVGIPGSGGDQWFRADVEYCMAFKREGKLPWTDNTAMGEPPKCPPGGRPTHRGVNGERLNIGFGKHWTANRRRGNGEREPWDYIPPAIANPGTLMSTGVAGGANIGHDMAHDNEAPYDERVPEFFIRSLCPPGGIVLDTFSGSGTTVSVANQHGRRGIGFDLRMSQCKLGRRRVASQFAPTTYRDTTKNTPAPLFGGAA